LRPCWSPQDPVRRRTNVPNSPIQCQCTVVELTWGPGSFLRNIATDPTVRVCVGQGLTHRLQGGTQIINRDLVRLLRKNPAATTGESEWHSLGLERPQIDSFVCSSAEDQTYYRPIPEDVRETRFLCTINAPNQSRLKTLVELWDLGRHSTLRDELIQG